MKGEELIARLIFFVDEELETQKFKEEMHSAVFQKRWRFGGT